MRLLASNVALALLTIALLAALGNCLAIFCVPMTGSGSANFIGAISWLRGSLGMPNNIAWLTSNDAPLGIGLLPLSFYAVLIVNVWLSWPFMMVVATGALQSIPSDLYEAANLDGANRRQQFWDITHPLLRPAMAPAIMYRSILTFNLFNVIYFITGGGPFGKTEILVTQAYRLVSEQRLYGVASAFAIIIFFILLAITLIQNRYLKGLEAGSMAAELEQNISGPAVVAERSAAREIADIKGNKPVVPLIERIVAHVALIVILFIVLFPVLWIFSLALDPRNIMRPSMLNFIPPGASFDAFERVLTDPLPNGVMFWTAFRNSLVVSIGTSLAVTASGVTAAYAFARFRFPGRKWGLFMFIAVQMLPGVATVAPPFVTLNSVSLP